MALNRDHEDGDQRWQAAAVVVGLALLLGGLIWWGMGQSGSGKGAPKRQVAKVSLLPDVKPPPPKEEPKKEPPKTEPKESVQINRPQVAAAPAPPGQQIKVEGGAGNAPSPFQSGVVTDERIPRDGLGGGGVPPPKDLAGQRLFAKALLGQLQSGLERELGNSELPKLTMRLRVWTLPSGAIERYDLVSLSRPEFEPEVRAAMELARAAVRASRVPPDMPQPIHLEMTVTVMNG